jgi:hypothetical protein
VPHLQVLETPIILTLPLKLEYIYMLNLEATNEKQTLILPLKLEQLQTQIQRETL